MEQIKRDTNTLYILRFVAAIMVVWYHFAPETFFSKNGSEAVTFFFFLSGFVMVIAYAKYLAPNSAHFSRTDFYIKRFARIYPLYFFALLALAIFHYLIKSIDTNTVKYRLPFEILGIQRWLYAGSFNAPAWTVSCEFFFYIIFPFALFSLKKNDSKFRLFAWVYYGAAYLITLILGVIIKMKLPLAVKIIVTALYLNPIFLISTFFLGMLAGKVFIDDKTRFFKNQQVNLVCFFACVTLVFLIKYFMPDPDFLRCGLLAPVYFVMVLSVTNFKPNNTKIMSNRFFIFLGEISYGIYILQAPVSQYFSYYVVNYKNSWTTFFCFIFSLIVFASVTHYIIEKPVKNLILNKFALKKPNDRHTT